MSVVTPSMNQAAYLEECIDSVLSQGYPKLEYVVIDGGSTDGSIEIIRRYEKHLTYWQSQPDSGPYAAVNAGFARTSGEVMTWINSDDKYPKGALLKAGWLFATEPDAEWITGRPLIWSPQGFAESVHVGPLAHSQTSFLAGHYDDPYIQQEGTFWRRTLWERAGGALNTDLELAADLELWVRFFRFAPLHCVDAFLGGFRQHGNQRSVLRREGYVLEAAAVVAAEHQRVEREGAAPALPLTRDLTIDSAHFREFVKELGLPVPDSDGVEEALLRTAVENSQSAYAAKAEALYKMVLNLNSALEKERRRSEWLYSSALWRAARRIRQLFR